MVRRAVAEDRWRRFCEAAGRRDWDRERGGVERRLDRLLARAKWPGRVLLLLRSGLWDMRVKTGLGRQGGAALGLVAYVRAGPDPAANPRALFDQAWYLENNPDIAGTPWAPLAHYLTEGDTEGRDPHPLFDLADYRATHAVKLAACGLTALQHFVYVGAREGYDPHPLFDLRHYVGQAETVAKSGENPLSHYLREGWREGLDPHPLFANDWYLERNPDVAALGVAPLLHYVTLGATEGRAPHPLFDAGWYAERSRETAPRGSSPLAQFVTSSPEYRRNPSGDFDSTYYLEQNPDAPRDLHPVIHYLTEGAFLGVSPASDFDEATYLADHPELVESPVAALEHWIRSRLPKPEGGARFGTAQDDGLFEQLRGQARQRDPGAYNTDAYRDLSAEARRLRERRKAEFRPEPLKLIHYEAREIDEAAARLAFPVVAAPRASIVIPAYNNLTFTLECLASVQAAGGLEAAEVIVIDDASTDRTPEVLAKVPGLRLITNPQNLNFIRTCNRAAGEARGEFVIFLNNDVQVREGWLAALLAPFAEIENVGATAPKMLFPDGRLQEAGARVGIDGTSEMIGLFEDPDLARWNQRREVDYASGACLAVRRAVFAELGGFDEAFVPAYCEDADLCFRLRKRGLRIIYEPGSEIVHHLSVTAESIDSGYKLRLATRNQQTFTERWGEELELLNAVRTIAFHLPQFHAIPENDRWWGAGFTEWTNVTRALPNYRGHYQPHRPADLGFYDLSQAEALRRQGELARRYGVSGFCHYFYWFSGGRRVLERPLEHLKTGAAGDFPFCLCWANENWTRTWDGQETDVLLEQTYAPGDAEALIAELAPFFARPNYIRVGGKPLVLIYRVGLLPDARLWAEVWRDWCRANGVGEIYLAFVETFEQAGAHPEPAALGFDASVEFPPAGAATPIHPPGAVVNPHFKGQVADYRRTVRHYFTEAVPGHTRFRGVAPSWDNTARRQDAPYVFHFASPGAFQAWLEVMLAETRRQNFGDERIVFINAWNEWAEGAHLEPDVKFGHGWLEAVRNALDADLLAR
ncbi:glycoside hydrolase family 99-like domain-containing protein [Phenylobacterium aquaticum]|uniref:glycoside hydrolase family 99-like domain-containing protein n=1 Tax=Phenylobacterium aquaticum TaxID=1763816 RepID=UPI0026F12234|nr:glycoside hydrolase family 99-like domain-containing protein [Phenylobacterium aquaticum]